MKRGWKTWVFALAALGAAAARADIAYIPKPYPYGNAETNGADVPVTREEWDRIQKEREREHNEARRRMLEERRRELERFRPPRFRPEDGKEAEIMGGW